MRNLGVNEAADAIRGKFFSDRSFRGDPEQAHTLKFAKDVAKALGAGETPEDVQHVMGLLREEGIALHTGHEYPKFATRKWDRTAKIVHSEDEERNWIDEKEPEPVDPATVAARTLDAPVQDLSLDLRDSVPQTVQPDHPAGRVPSAVTNREAAQDAYARQPVEDHAHDDHTHMDETHVDDDEVHIEDLAGTGSHAEGGAPYAKPANEGVMAHDDADRDGVMGQDDNPTHDSPTHDETPRPPSSSAAGGARKPVGDRKRPL